jgi:hypothetical protein
MGIVVDRIGLLMAACGADEHLDIGLEGGDGLDRLEPQLAMAVLAMQRGRRLNQVPHRVSFRSTGFAAKQGRSNGSGQFDRWEAERLEVSVSVHGKRLIHIQPIC